MTDQNRAITTYTSTGRTQVIQDTFSIDTVNFNAWWWNDTSDSGGGGGGGGDPLAQTFSFTEDTIVPAIGLFFGTKDVVPITLQLRNTVNGYPGPIALGSVTLQPGAVNVSNDGSAETVFTFQDPILLSRDVLYSWVLMTEGSQYRAWVAKMGNKDVRTNEWVPAQPFIGGTLFSSNDNMAWTAHQEMDAKFNIYKSVFTNTDAILNFNKLTGIEAAQLVLIVNQLTPAGTSIKWEVSADGINNWLPININTGVNSLPSKYADCYIRATLSGQGRSPLINLSAVVATGIKFALTSKYINRNIVTLSNFTTIKVWMDVKEPVGTSVTPKFSVNDGSTWTNCTYVTSQPGEKAGYTQKYFTNTVSATNQFRIDLDFIGLETSTAEIRRLMVNLT